MISIKQLNEYDIDLCNKLDSKTISLWSKDQWANEIKKDGTKVFGLLTWVDIIQQRCQRNIHLD